MEGPRRSEEGSARDSSLSQPRDRKKRQYFGKSVFLGPIASLVRREVGHHVWSGGVFLYPRRTKRFNPQPVSLRVSPRWRFRDSERRAFRSRHISRNKTTMAPSEFWLDLTAGWISGAVSVVVVQPVDTTLTRMQALRVRPGVESGPRAVFQTVLKEGGTRALWRGTAPMTFVIPFQNALLFAGYGLGNAWAKSLRGDDAEGGKASSASAFSTYAPVFAGGTLGGIAQSFAVSPFELVKIKQQSAGVGTVNVLQVAKQLGKQLGPGVFSKGLGPTLLRDGIPHGVWFVAYEWSKTQLEARLVDGDGKGKDETDKTPSSQHTAIPLCAGAFAAAVAWGVGYPFDTIKTRIQASAVSNFNSGLTQGKAGEKAALGVWATGRAMVAENNGNVVAGLYRGFNLKLLRAVPASAVAFFVYEESRRWLG